MGRLGVTTPAFEADNVCGRHRAARDRAATARCGPVISCTSAAACSSTGGKEFSLAPGAAAAPRDRRRRRAPGPRPPWARPIAACRPGEVVGELRGSPDVTARRRRGHGPRGARRRRRPRRRRRRLRGGVRRPGLARRRASTSPPPARRSSPPLPSTSRNAHATADASRRSASRSDLDHDRLRELRVGAARQGRDAGQDVGARSPTRTIGDATS